MRQMRPPSVRPLSTVPLANVRRATMPLATMPLATMPFATKSLATVFLAALLACATVAVAASHTDASDANGATERQATAVPELPFDDNPDPDQCGIPQPLGDTMRAVVSGVWEGELLFEHVHLYDSHLRANVTGTVPNGSTVDVAMYQNNPVLDYWFVRWEGPDGAVEGWLPDPFLER